MNVDIELRFADDRIYLNWWDTMHGRDICCQIKDGKIMKYVHDPAENEELEAQHADYDPLATEEVSITEWAEMIRDRVSQQRELED